jgi:hypothetical protein
VEVAVDRGAAPPVGEHREQAGRRCGAQPPVAVEPDPAHLGEREGHGAPDQVALDQPAPVRPVGVMELLAPDAVLWADGGGKFKAPLRPIHGADKIARFFVAIRGEALTPGSSVEIAEVNGGAAAVLVGPTGPIAVLQVDLDDTQRITDIRLMGNPDKLAGLTPTGMI